jgi:hypothetical protein
MIAPLGEAFGKTATDFSGGPGHEDFHAPRLVTRASPGLEKSDIHEDA